MKKILLVLSVFVFVGFFCVGCKKTSDEVTQEAEAEYDQPTKDISSVKKETAPEPTITAPEQAISPLMEQFLRTSAGSHMNVTAGGSISAWFEFFEEILHHRSVEIYFEVEAEGKIQKDHVWENKTYRTVLDEYCHDNDLVWKITGPNTIRIEKKTM